ncbi:PREDICTED: LOC110765193 isoform [Prunus dulcis]|uniref:PREDICTED: LOC110765193 isoform n=1 Tax=Prunus dulcis TaxID=3755 RepID=A0A5E4GIJ1_PRUDU|nr:PREDICTED: LOC110765193 isoform [Prunus dulcis]
MPLDAFVQINWNWYNIEYEGLPDICYLCGRYGRKQEKCEVNVKDVETVNGETTIAMGADVEGSSSVGINRAHYEYDQSLRGPWMNVLPRSRPQSNFKGVGGKVSGVKNKGSRFDALRQVGENFGKDEGNVGEFFCQTGNRRMQPFLTDLNMGNKVWTKSKGTNSVARQVLEDISNKSLPMKNRVKENCQNTGVAIRNTPGC